MSSDETPTVYLNHAAKNAIVPGPDLTSAPEVLSFHQKLPQYRETPLHSLPAVAQELNVSHVFVKDESNRFGLPSFKILGASWAVLKALAERTGIDYQSLINNQHDPAALWTRLESDASSHGLTVVTCTEGNWGRAVARMAKYVGMPAKIFVPCFMPQTTRDRVRSEGAEVVVVNGNYDDSVAAARTEAETNPKAILVMDMGWDGYEMVPQWVVEGYSTMLNETDVQMQAVLPGRSATNAFVPVGVGSIAEAVTQHYKRHPPGHDSRASIATVEPTTAACLMASLEAGKITTVQTKESIMCGMNCGTVSTTAWPTLSMGVDADITVTDAEAHLSVCQLEQHGLQPGPCGAATLAALKRACCDARNDLGLNSSSVVVLFCTEGAREYEAPS